MSKLLELMKAVPTGRVHLRFTPLNTLCDIKEEYTSAAYDREYRISASFGAKVVVNDSCSDSSHDLDYAVKEVKQSVNEAVFGEFRAPLREIQKLLWERNYQKASEKLSELETQMYTV